MIAFNLVSGSQLQDVVGLTASLDYVSSDNALYRPLLLSVQSKHTWLIDNLIPLREK